MQVYKLCKSWIFDRRWVLSITHIIYYTVLADGPASYREITSNHPTLYNINVRSIRIRPLENSPSMWNVFNILTGRRQRTTITPYHTYIPGIKLVGCRHIKFARWIPLKVRSCFAIDTLHRVSVQARVPGLQTGKGFVGTVTFRTMYYAHAIINL